LGKLSKRGTKPAFKVEEESMQQNYILYSNDRPVPVMCYTTIIMHFDLHVKYHTRIQVFHILNGYYNAF